LTKRALYVLYGGSRVIVPNQWWLDTSREEHQLPLTRYNLASHVQPHEVPATPSLTMEEAGQIVHAAYQAHKAAMRTVVRWWKERKSQGADFIGVPVLNPDQISKLKAMQILVPVNPRKPNGRLTCNEQLWLVIEHLQISGAPIRGQEDLVPASVPPPSRPSAPSSRRSGRVQRDLEDPAQLTKTDLRALARPGSTSLFADGDDDITQVMHRDEIVALDEIAAGASNT
jgi:hypothetical protein